MEGLKACMRYVFILSAMIIVGIFATDWWFTRDGNLLNDTLVGIMMGAPLGWFGAFVTFYTTEKVTQILSKDTEPPTKPVARNEMEGGSTG